MEKIESAANRKIKLAASLARRKHRDREGLFVAEGVLMLIRAGALFDIREAVLEGGPGDFNIFRRLQILRFE